MLASKDALRPETLARPTLTSVERVGVNPGVADEEVFPFRHGGERLAVQREQRRGQVSGFHPPTLQLGCARELAQVANH